MCPLILISPLISLIPPGFPAQQQPEPAATAWVYEYDTPSTVKRTGAQSPLAPAGVDALLRAYAA